MGGEAVGFFYKLCNRARFGGALGAGFVIDNECVDCTRGFIM